MFDEIDDPLEDKNKNLSPDDQKTALQKQKEAITKQLMKVICICKGINLGKVLKGLEGSETVADVNAKTGCGSGGCQGERCGPRIKILLRKKQEADAAKK